MYAWLDDVLKINDIMPLSCMLYDVWMWNICWNVSSSQKINPWQMLVRLGKLNPRLLLGMKNVCIFKLCLGCFHWGFPFCCFKEKSAGEINFGLRNLCGECWFLLGEKSSGVLVVRYSTGELYSWLGRMEVNNLLGIKKLTVIWMASRLCSNSLGIVTNFTWEEEFC